MEHLLLPTQAYVGIDVAKLTLDVMLLSGKSRSHATFDNTATGFEKLLTWLRRHRVEDAHFCLEATGIYSYEIANFLYDQHKQVSVMNPRLIHDYRKGLNLRSKTDRLDAALLAQYARERQPQLWRPLPATVQRLLQLVSHRETLLRIIGQIKNRKETIRDLWIRKQEDALLADLKEKEQAVVKELKTCILADEELKGIWKRLQTMVGVGPTSATYIVAYVGSIDRFENASSLVNYAGLSVVEHSSGTSVQDKPHIDRMGRGQLRKMLYMCALVSKRWDPLMKQWAHTLSEKGKKKKVVIVAVMRKMLHIIYGMWKHQRDYDPNLAFPHAAVVQAAA
jgi:transposase